MNDNSETQRNPFFNKKRASAMVGKRVLIGLTYYDHNGTFLEQKQMHGKIVSANVRGFAVELEGSREGETYWLPPDLRGFREAKPGEYHEHSTGEIITDPDFLSTWEVTKPEPRFQAEE